MPIMPSSRNWESDPVSGKQKDFILRHRLATLTEVQLLTKGEASTLISRFTKSRTDVQVEPATEPQIALIRTLANETGSELPNLANLTKVDAGTVITELRSRRAQRPEFMVGEGLYILGGDVFKVKKSKGGRLYCLRLVQLSEPEYRSNGVRTHRFIPASFGLCQLRPENAMTREQAQKFGQQTSACVRCGIKLESTITQEDGSPRWIGPVCQKKMGW